MFDSLWTNLRIATMEKDNPYIMDGAIGITKNQIEWIGSIKDLPTQEAKDVHSCSNAWVTPGLIDCHTHLIFAGNRAKEFAMRQQGATYEEIAQQGGGIQLTVNATRKATEQELYDLAKERLERFLKEGVTTVEIKSGYGLDFESEIKILRVATQLQQDLPMRIYRTFLGAHICPKEYQNDKDGYIEFLCKELLPEIYKQKLADSVDAFCETIAFSPEQVSKLFTTAQNLGLPVRLHADQLHNLEGGTLAAQYHALSADHLEYLSEAGVEALAKSNTVAVLTPGSYYFLKEDKKPPIENLKKHHVPIAISTDLNPGTSPINSLATIRNMACVFFGFTPEDTLIGVTRNSAQALGMSDHIGTLSIGKKADFVIWKIDELDELSYGIGFDPKKTVVINGKVVYDTLT